MKKLCALCLCLSIFLTGCGFIQELSFLDFDFKRNDRKKSSVENSLEMKEDSGDSVIGEIFEPMETADDSLRFDGLYCYITGSEDSVSSLNYVFRFYEDGTVISVTVGRSTLEQSLFPSSEWFNKDNSGMARGTYTLEGNDISFTSISSVGAVDYEGTLENGCLILDSYSHINGNEDKNKKYVFYADDKIVKD